MADNVLIGKKSIMEYAGLSKYLYDKFRKNKSAPMPILIIDGQHYSTKENIDKYFNNITWANSSNIEDDDKEG